MEKIAELDQYMQRDLKLSKSAAMRRIARIDATLGALSAPVGHALCRYRTWRLSGWRCVSFEGWVFAYQVFPDGVIVRDMAHGSVLTDVVS